MLLKKVLKKLFNDSLKESFLNWRSNFTEQVIHYTSRKKNNVTNLNQGLEREVRKEILTC